MGTPRRPHRYVTSALTALAIFTAAAMTAATASTGASAPALGAAQELHSQFVRANYDKREVMVPMRDGVELFTAIYTPKDRSRTYPIMLFRTPYSVGPYGPDRYRARLGPSPEFDRAGYIYVFQDVRGQFRSEGEFAVMRFPAAEPKGPTDTDEITDNYDTIEWALNNIEGHNGRVGQWGISYPGWQTVMGMIDAHPALKASSPQASPSDMFIGDDWHHNGAFRVMYAFSWLSLVARRQDGPYDTFPERFDYGTPWGYEFFLDSGAAANLDERYLGGQVPEWRDFMRHPDYDEYWQRQNALQYLQGIEHPILNVAGWFDTEDFYGPMSIYRTVEANNPGIENTLVVGPWLHGGWASMEGDFLGCIGFDDKTSLTFQREVQFPFFEHHLRPEGGSREVAAAWDPREAVVFETGANRWQRYDSWPPPGVTPRNLYLHEGGRLSFEPPTGAGDEAADRYDSDPDKPVPFSAEIRTLLGHLWKVEDQRFAATRPDVLVYRSEVLTEDVTIAGEILAEMFVSTTGTDSDWIVKLIDVYPGDAPGSEAEDCFVPMGGYQMHLAGEIMRGRYRNSFEHPEAMVPGEVTPVTINLRDKLHTFKAGHRIMVQVQSSWFPAYDRNPQQFVDIYHAEPAEYVKATQTVWRTADHPSHLVLPVLER
jgi:putative CocE/NonD family hydrolase